MTGFTDLIRAFKEKPDLAPFGTNPMAVFFLVSLDNFRQAWKEWLSWGLNAAKYKYYQLDKFQSEDQLTILYDTLIGYISQGKHHSATKLSPHFKLIFDRTLQLRKLHDQAEQNAKSRLRPCKICQNLPDHQKCVQSRFVKLENSASFWKRWRKAGVTAVADEKEQMKPKKSKPITSVPTTLAHFSKLHLQQFGSDKSILERCGKQVIYVQDAETRELAIYGAFKEDMLTRLCDNAERALSVRSLIRGGQFQWWVNGFMRPFGSREAMGGYPGDAYNPYAGIEADTEKGINVLFDHADSSAIIVQTAWVFFPNLVKDMEKRSQMCTKIGYSGVTLYDCNGYAAPQHFDPDVAHSLSVQLKLYGIQEDWHEFSFCASQYGYFFKTEPNMLWWATTLLGYSFLNFLVGPSGLSTYMEPCFHLKKQLRRSRLEKQVALASQ
ncbi:hypothetical protein GYMLUDRAFT_177179 [Collybiopsis luxurians FD-317 M1]|uniref:Uncharacterized protein n=1 Tax=Collybiopsis luxurians FD-317 M1 TaxID=944289 RepID=A0A0D0BXL4_9AGAR|nr:hypothetical protein GYMLUDRAFT_177179 [Collybiopsis luxurians FD-317 M1]